MSKRKRRNYTSEFKSEAVKLVTEQGYSLAVADRNLGVSANSLRTWKRKIEAVNGDESMRRRNGWNWRGCGRRFAVCGWSVTFQKKATAFFANERN
ncbi:MAG: transposase [Pirellulales bacterium]